MARDTDADAILEALDHLQTIQEQHGEVLVHLEQREVPDMQGLVRRLEDVADAVERLAVPVRERQPMPRWFFLVCWTCLPFICGYVLCWATIRWVPSAMLPPGFSRVEPTKQKGRF